MRIRNPVWTQLNLPSVVTKHGFRMLKLPFVLFFVVSLVYRGLSRFFEPTASKEPQTALIPSFCDELKEKCGPEVHHLLEEAENLLVDRQGWVVVGLYLWLVCGKTKQMCS